MKKIKIVNIVRVIILLFIVSYPIHVYYSERNYYYNELNMQVNGIITDKYRAQPNNPKAYIVKINDSITFELEYGMNDLIEIGDSISKKKNENFFIFFDNSNNKKTIYEFKKPSFW
jgi:hypothetical protein